MTTLDTATRIVPVLLLFVTGFALKRTGFIAASTIADMKKVVVNITLPALMFTAFSSLEPGVGELILAASILVFSTVLLLASRAADHALSGRWGIRSYMMGGFEAGMLGYALFLSVFGDGALPVFASVDLGQVIFVFVILMPILQTRRTSSNSNGSSVAATILRRIVTSPIVWAIAGGLVVGAVGRSIAAPVRFLAPVESFLGLLGGITAPVIAMVIGYELELKRDVLARALLFVLIRKIVLVGSAVLALWLIPGIPDLTRFAVLTLLLLPPPYVVALANRDDEKALTAGILSASTVISVIAFAIVVIVSGGSIIRLYVTTPFLRITLA